MDNPSTENPSASGNKAYPKLDSDDAKSSIKQDEFGLRQMVEAVSEGLVRFNEPKSYVVGIEGEWGSGKSSFVNFIEEQINAEEAKVEKKKRDRRIIRFEPWLIGESQALLDHFFQQLASE